MFGKYIYFEGTWEECHSDFEKISEMEESENQKNSQNSLVNIKDGSKSSALKPEILEARIKQMELSLIEKEFKIINLEKKLQEQEEINLALKNTFSQ